MIVHQLSELSKPRLNPHIVTEALKNLLKKRIIFKINKPFQNKVNIPCYTFQYSKKFQLERVEKRKKQIFPFLDRLKNNKNEEHNKLHKQLGYALEIPIFKRLKQLAIDNNYELQGSFKNYTINDFNSAQKKEPKLLINNVKTKGKVDFILKTNEDTLIIECKNIRQWIYPNNKEFLKLLQKAIDTNTIPVLITRKTHFNKNLDQFIFENLLPSAQKARKLFNLAKPSLQQWINKEITLTQLYQNVKNNSKSTKKIQKLIEDNINFVNQFNINKSY